MLQVEAQKLGGDGMGLDLIKGGQGRDEKIKVCQISS